MEKQFITRSEYMKDSSLHGEYFAQFVTESIKSLLPDVTDRIANTTTILDAVQNGEGYLNEIPLKWWDSQSWIASSYAKGLKQAEEQNTLSTQVCILKAAARIKVKEYLKEK